MKSQKITYTVKPEYAAQNTANIKLVMDELKANNLTGVVYYACVAEDGKTFTHTVFFENGEAQKELQNLPAFINFQQQLKQSGPEVPPKVEALTFVGASFNLFNN